MEEREQASWRFTCFEFLTHLLDCKRHPRFRQIEHISPSDEQGTATVASTSSVQTDTRNDTDLSSPRPLSHTDPGCSHSQRQNDGFVLRRAKGPIPLHEKSQLLRYDILMNIELMENLNESKHEGGSMMSSPESSSKQPLSEMTTGTTYLHSESEDEDVCPICLDEFTYENPRIILKCTHIYHLSCIFEWLERSESCPICSKMVQFEEET
ncbi:E3 ubiquitin-protein ligase [Musa troglodytarum]|uniref:RING-type E3 ubiquitin transferase n=1 Tax=Musa troglodytarum TaxID=320322 RepID=A0A9E7JUK8_9LILI|nr:E3 ubiquitin-protein ligase [Musa troglodytarum]